MQLSDGLSGGAVHDRLDLTQVHVLDPGRPVSGGRQEAAAGPRHEDAGEVAGVVEPGAVQVVLRTARAAAVQLLTHTRAHAHSAVHKGRALRFTKSTCRVDALFGTVDQNMCFLVTLVVDNSYAN